MSTANKTVGFRRSVLDTPSRKKGGKGWRGSFRNRFDIPKDVDAEILITRGKYPNPTDVDQKTKEPRLAHYHTCKMHKMKFADKGPGSFFTARCNIDAGQNDCVACLRQQNGDNRVGLTDTFSLNVLHLALYESVPLERDGKVVKYEEGENRGKPVMVWEIVERPKRMKTLLDDLEANLEDGVVALFQKKYVEVGPRYLTELSKIDEMASKMCKCGGDLTPTHFYCEECEEILVDVSEDDLSPREVENFANERARCSKCDHIGLPIADTVCSDCKNPAPMSAFDVVATVRKEGEGVNSHIVVKKVTRIDDYELPGGISLIEWENTAPKGGKAVLSPKFDANDDFVFTEDFDVRKNVEAQWDFETIHAPRDHELIAQKLGCKNPFGSEGGSPGSKYKNYGSERTTRVANVRDRDGDDDTDESPAEKRTGRDRQEEAEPPRRRRRV